MNRFCSLLARYAAGLLAPTLLTLLVLDRRQPLVSTNIALLLQLGILLVAVSGGLGPSILAALVSTVAFHYFFLAPHYSFAIASREDVLLLLIFLGLAVSMSVLMAWARSQASAARQRVAELGALYELSQLTSAQVDLATILPQIAATTCRLLAVPACTILLADDGRLTEHTRVGAAGSGDVIDMPLRHGDALIGVVRAEMSAPGDELSPHQRQLLETIAAQVRLVVLRIRLVAQTAHAQALAESDQLKSALLTSVSHDLRTPLAAIKGAASTLLISDADWQQGDRRILEHTIEREADRLNQFVGNLLAMSRIEAGALQLERDWHDLAELIGVVLRQQAALLADRAISVEVAPDVPPIWSNATLLQHVLTNLVENAAKYSPAASPLKLTVSCADDEVRFALRDYGPGIVPRQLGRIFDKFYRGTTPRAAVSGSGLGLTICKGIVQAHGGRIWAENCAGGGAEFVFTLPLKDAGPVVAGAYTS